MDRGRITYEKQFGDHHAPMLHVIPIFGICQSGMLSDIGAFSVSLFSEGC